MTRIRELLDAGPTYSFEFFPPKNDRELATLARTIGELQPLEPSFVSVTYRGGAASRQRTYDLVSGMLHTTRLNPMAHLICVAHTRLELADILVSLRKAGVENLMALGGDQPEDPENGTRRAGVRVPAGGARPRHRRLLGGGRGPSRRPPALAGPPERPRPPGGQARPGRLRRDAVLLRGGGVPGPRRRPARPRCRHTGPAGHPPRHLAVDHGPARWHGRGCARMDGGPTARGRRARRQRTRYARRGSSWPPSSAPDLSLPACRDSTSTRSTPRARPVRSTPRSGSDRRQRHSADFSRRHVRRDAEGRRRHHGVCRTEYRKRPEYVCSAPGSCCGKSSRVVSVTAAGRASRSRCATARCART